MDWGGRGGGPVNCLVEQLLSDTVRQGEAAEPERDGENMCSALVS